MKVHLQGYGGIPCTLGPLDIALDSNENLNDVGFDRARQLLSKEPFSSDVVYNFVGVRRLEGRGHEPVGKPLTLGGHQTVGELGLEGGRQIEEFQGTSKEGQRREAFDVYCIRMSIREGMTMNQLAEKLKEEFGLSEACEVNLVRWKRLPTTTIEDQKHERVEDTLLTPSVASGRAKVTYIVNSIQLCSP